jgi:hypothetical protein
MNNNNDKIRVSISKFPNLKRTYNSNPFILPLYYDVNEEEIQGIENLIKKFL